MDITLFWAVVLGTWSIILGVAILLNIKHYQKLMVNFFKDYPTLMVFSLFEVFIGLLIFTSHRIWTGWEMLITLYGLGMLLEGSFYLIFPEYMHRFKKKVLSQSTYLGVSSVLFLVIGIYLFYQGVF